jgi:ubiquitin-like-conjugating enzyme ATG10
MRQIKAVKMDIHDFPYLDRSEFAEVCHRFDSLYRRATLGPLRKRWKLRLCTAFDGSFIVDAEYTTFVQIIRPLEATLDHDDLSSHIDNFSFQDAQGSESMEEDTDMAQVEDADEVCSIQMGA